MSSALRSNRDQRFGFSRTVDFVKRSLCPWCTMKMKIRDTSKPRIVVDLSKIYLSALDTIDALPPI